MTNKELAVQLYGAYLQAAATTLSNPNFKDGSIKLPTNEEMVKNVGTLAHMLSSIVDE